MSTQDLKFRKSSRSAADAKDCVEVANTLGALRDSKNPAGPVLHVDVTTLVTGIKSGRY
jgi:hypothetical protein